MVVNLCKQVSECIQIKKSRKNNNLRDFYKENNYLLGSHFNLVQRPDRPCFVIC